MQLIKKWLEGRGPFLLAIALGVVGVFSSTIGPEFIWDDQFFIRENRFLERWESLPSLLTTSMNEGASGTPSNFYRPLQALTHFIDVQLFGFDPVFHHYTNIALFALAGMVLFLLLSELLGDEDKKIRWTALFALSLWLFHPLQCEVVGYLSGRGDLLVYLFFGLAALSWRKHRIFSCLFCAAAMFSKESGIMVPVFVVICDLIWRRGQLERKQLLAYLPLALLASLYAGARLTVLNFRNTLNFFDSSNVLTEHYLARVYTYFSTLAKAAQLALWPVDLHHERGWQVYAGINFPIVWAGAAFFLVLAFTAIWGRKRWTFASAGAAWFLAGTLPTSNLVALINALFYDHWFVLPLFGAVLALAALFRFLVARISLLLVGFAWAVFFLPLGTLSWKQGATWQTAEAQYQHILKFEPNSWKMMNNLAMRYAESGRFDEAEKLYLRSIDLGETPQAHNNLARLYMAKNRWEPAETEFQKAIKMDPLIFQSFTGLGLLKLQLGQCAAAVVNFEAALKIYPDRTAAQGLERARLCAK